MGLSNALKIGFILEFSSVQVFSDHKAEFAGEGLTRMILRSDTDGGEGAKRGSRKQDKGP